MNKKAITDFISTLILGSIAVSVIFIGVFYSYKTLACYLGTDLSQVSLKVGNPGRFNEQSLSLNVLSKEINLSYCNNTCLLNNYDKYCSDKNSEDCLDTCSNLYNGNKSSYDSSCPNCNNNNDCLTYCTAKSCVSNCEAAYKDSSKLNYFFNVTYKGATPTTIGIAVNEIKEGSNIPILIYSDETKDPLRYGDNYVFNKNFTKHENCKSEMTVKLIPKEESSSVRELTKTFENDFCLTIPEKKVNVSVHDFSYGSNSLSVTAAIDGEDVSTLCPDALFSFTLYNKTSNSEEVPIDGSGQSCQFILSTNRSKMPNGWFNDLAYKYRAVIKVTNDMNIPTLNDELAEVSIDLSSFADIVGNCKNIVVTNSSSHPVSKWSSSGDINHNCYIQFTTGPSFPPGSYKIFYVYFGKSGLYSHEEPEYKDRPYIDLGPGDLIEGLDYAVDENGMKWWHTKITPEVGVLPHWFEEYCPTGGYCFFTYLTETGYTSPKISIGKTIREPHLLVNMTLNSTVKCKNSSEDSEYFICENCIASCDASCTTNSRDYKATIKTRDCDYCCLDITDTFIHTYNIKIDNEIPLISYDDLFRKVICNSTNCSDKSYMTHGTQSFGVDGDPIYFKLFFNLSTYGSSRPRVAPIVHNVRLYMAPRLATQHTGTEGICSPLMQTLTCSNIKNFNAANNCGLTNTSKVMGVLWTDKYSEPLDWMNDNQEILDNVGCIS